MGPSPGFNEAFGYTEPLRRFIQREGFEPQANEIPNTMPSWMPGDDYYTDFHKGDPYIKVDQGFARLPGSGYAALHPELDGVDPEDYPDIHKMAILADVAPYSREYNTRDFRPLPCFGTIEKHYRQRRECSHIPIYMNRLRSIFCCHDCPPLPPIRSGAGQASLTTSKTAPTDSKTAPKTAPPALALLIRPSLFPPLPGNVYTPVMDHNRSPTPSDSLPLSMVSRVIKNRSTVSVRLSKAQLDVLKPAIEQLVRSYQDHLKRCEKCN